MHVNFEIVEKQYWKLNVPKSDGAHSWGKIQILGKITKGLNKTPK